MAASRPEAEAYRGGRILCISVTHDVSQSFVLIQHEI